MRNYAKLLRTLFLELRTLFKSIQLVCLSFCLPDQSLIVAILFIGMKLQLDYAKKEVLKLSNIKILDSDNYTCVVKNQLGSAKATSNIKVIPISKTCEG